MQLADIWGQEFLAERSEGPEASMRIRRPNCAAEALSTAPDAE